MPSFCAVARQQAAGARVQVFTGTSSLVTAVHPRYIGACPYGVWGEFVHEVFDDAIEVAPRLATPGRRGEVRKDLSRAGESAYLWLLKPYGQPIVLSADGTLTHMLRIDDGINRCGKLFFTMAERVAVSTPIRPLGAVHNGRPVPFDFDARQCLARVRGTGRLGECELEF